jgi:transcriptional regulator with GAF, ATPase, and Fis domain
VIDGEWRFGAAAINRWLEGSCATLAGDSLADIIQPVLTEIGTLRRAFEETSARIALSGDDGTVGRRGMAIDFQLSQSLTLTALEDAYIRYVLRECADNKTRAAEWLGIDASTLHRKLKKLDEAQ